MATRPRASKKAVRKPARKPTTRAVSLKFRLEPERAAVVARIAKAEGKTESEVLRESIDLLERSRERREHAPKLADFITTIPPAYRRR